MTGIKNDQSNSRAQQLDRGTIDEALANTTADLRASQLVGGPPGTGKVSKLRQLAKEAGISLIEVNASSIKKP